MCSKYAHFPRRASKPRVISKGCNRSQKCIKSDLIGGSRWRWTRVRPVKASCGHAGIDEEARRHRLRRSRAFDPDAQSVKPFSVFVTGSAGNGIAGGSSSPCLNLLARPMAPGCWGPVTAELCSTTRERLRGVLVDARLGVTGMGCGAHGLSGRRPNWFILPVTAERARQSVSVCAVMLLDPRKLAIRHDGERAAAWGACRSFWNQGNVIRE